MKKLLISMLLGLAVSVSANAQIFNHLRFLDVAALSVTNTGGFTNTASYFGWSTTTSTNSTGLQYTNKFGTYIIVPTTNAITGINTVSNGVAFYTNDPTVLCLDVPNHSDRNGNVTTNWLINCAAQFNTTSTGAVVCVFAPVVENPLASQNNFTSAVKPLPTILDLANTQTVAFPVLRGGATNTTAVLNNIGPYRGWRLISAGMTNAAGQAWIYDLSINSYVP